MEKWLDNLIGNPVEVFAILLIAYFIDLMIGVTDYWTNGQYRSQSFSKGYIAKIILLVGNLTFGMLLLFVFSDDKDNWILTIIINGTGAFLLWNEVVSMLTHLSRLGLSLPSSIQTRLDQETKSKDEKVEVVEVRDAQ
jgi:toxin secretion/phage lysis holin